LSVIPPRYRNDEESRRAIADGRLDEPWPGGEGEGVSRPRG